MIRKICFCIVMLFLLLPILFAAQPCKKCKETFIVMKVEGKKAYAVLYSREVIKIGDLFYPQDVSVKPVPDMKIYFYFKNTPITDCYPVKTNESGVAVCENITNVNPPEVANIVGCTQIKAEFNSSDEYYTDSVGTGSYCVGIPIAFGKIDITICLPFFLILGLLAAGMYAMGKSPFAPFDLSIPKIPKGKFHAMKGWTRYTGFAGMMSPLIRNVKNIRDVLKEVSKKGAKRDLRGLEINKKMLEALGLEGRGWRWLIKKKTPLERVIEKHMDERAVRRALERIGVSRGEIGRVYRREGIQGLKSLLANRINAIDERNLWDAIDLRNTTLETIKEMERIISPFPPFIHKLVGNEGWRGGISRAVLGSRWAYPLYTTLEASRLLVDGVKLVGRSYRGLAYGVADAVAGGRRRVSLWAERKLGVRERERRIREAEGEVRWGDKARLWAIKLIAPSIVRGKIVDGVATYKELMENEEVEQETKKMWRSHYRDIYEGVVKHMEEKEGRKLTYTEKKELVIKLRNSYICELDVLHGLLKYKKGADKGLEKLENTQNRLNEIGRIMRAENKIRAIEDSKFLDVNEKTELIYAFERNPRVGEVYLEELRVKCENKRTTLWDEYNSVGREAKRLVGGDRDRRVLDEVLGRSPRRSEEEIVEDVRGLLAGERGRGGLLDAVLCMSGRRGEGVQEMEAIETKAQGVKKIRSLLENKLREQGERAGPVERTMVDEFSRWINLLYGRWTLDNINAEGVGERRKELRGGSEIIPEEITNKRPWLYSMREDRTYFPIDERFVRTQEASEYYGVRINPLHDRFLNVERPPGPIRGLVRKMFGEEVGEWELTGKKYESWTSRARRIFFDTPLTGIIENITVPQTEKIYDLQNVAMTMQALTWNFMKDYEKGKYDVKYGTRTGREDRVFGRRAVVESLNEGLLREIRIKEIERDDTIRRIGGVFKNVDKIMERICEEDVNGLNLSDQQRDRLRNLVAEKERIRRDIENRDREIRQRTEDIEGMEGRCRVLQSRYNEILGNIRNILTLRGVGRERRPEEITQEHIAAIQNLSARDREELQNLINERGRIRGDIERLIGRNGEIGEITRIRREIGQIDAQRRGLQNQFNERIEEIRKALPESVFERPGGFPLGWADRIQESDVENALNNKRILSSQAERLKEYIQRRDDLNREIRELEDAYEFSKKQYDGINREIQGINWFKQKLRWGAAAATADMPAGGWHPWTNPNYALQRLYVGLKKSAETVEQPLDQRSVDLYAGLGGMGSIFATARHLKPLAYWGPVSLVHETIPAGGIPSVFLAASHWLGKGITYQTRPLIMKMMGLPTPYEKPVHEYEGIRGLDWFKEMFAPLRSKPTATRPMVAEEEPTSELTGKKYYEYIRDEEGRPVRTWAFRGARYLYPFHVMRDFLTLGATYALAPVSAIFALADLRSLYIRWPEFGRYGGGISLSAQGAPSGREPGPTTTYVEGGRPITEYGRYMSKGELHVTTLRDWKEAYGGVRGDRREVEMELEETTDEQRREELQSRLNGLRKRERELESQVRFYANFPSPEKWTETKYWPSFPVRWGSTIFQAKHAAAGLVVRTFTREGVTRDTRTSYIDEQDVKSSGGRLLKMGSVYYLEPSRARWIMENRPELISSGLEEDLMYKAAIAKIYLKDTNAYDAERMRWEMVRHNTAWSWRALAFGMGPAWWAGYAIYNKMLGMKRNVKCGRCGKIWRAEVGTCQSCGMPLPII